MNDSQHGECITLHGRPLVGGSGDSQWWLIKDMAWSDNYHCGLWSGRREKEIAFAAVALFFF